MDFALTDEQQAVLEAVRRYGREKLAPRYQAREREGRIEDGLLRELGGLGFIAPEVPEEFGGLGLDAVTTGLIAEETAYHDFNVSYVQLMGSLNAAILVRSAPELARTVVPRICAGEILVGLGLTEPGGGSDAANLKLRARRDGDGYVLDGEKASASFAAHMDEIILFARTGTPEARAHGISAFLVDMHQDGVKRLPYDDVGTKVVGRGSVFFDGARVPVSRRLGEEGQGFVQVMQGFDYSRALIGLQCLGAARASLDETWQYITERHAFGRPIAKYQGVTDPLAAFQTQLEAARLLCFKTLWLRDRGLPHTAEAAMVKWWGPKLAFDIIHQCLLTHGHSGYSTDMPHQQRLRDVMGLEIGDGTAQIQKMIVARERIGRVALPYV